MINHNGWTDQTVAMLAGAVVVLALLSWGVVAIFDWMDGRKK